MVVDKLCGWLEAGRGQVAGAKYLPIDILSHYFINPHIRELAMSALLKAAA